MPIKARRPGWIFDGSEIADPFGYGERAVDFLRRLHHPKSESGMIDLPLFWERIVRRIYGPAFPDGRRQVRTAFILLPRGARKTTVGAGLSLLHTVGWEKRPSGQAMVAASAEEDATIAYDEAVGLINATPWLEGKMKLNESTFVLEHIKTKSRFRALATGGKGKLGKTPHFVLADELIAWEGEKSRKTWSALRTGMNKVPASLMVIISQAGRGRENLAYPLLDYARRVQDGHLEDPGFLPIIFETDSDEASKWSGDGVAEFSDWSDEALWHYVNPGLDLGYPDIDGLRQMAREAKERPADRDDFRQFHLNTWLHHSASPFVDMNVYDAGSAAVDLDQMEADQVPGWLAVDLSSTTDLTVIVACWVVDGVYHVWPWYFCPEDNIDSRATIDGVPYRIWSEEGWIEPTPGNVVDYGVIEQRVEDLCARFNVREVAFDPWRARQTITNLQNKGLPVVEMQQGIVTMGPAINELERVIIGRNLRHGGHPILRWNFDNVAMRPGTTDLSLFHKGMSKDRIDGAQASAMAVARAAAGDTGRSSYDDADDDFEEWAYA